MGQLKTTDRTGTTWDRAWKYDGIGNRTRQVGGSTDPDAAYPGIASSQAVYASNAANQYATVALNTGAATAADYDADGNCTVGRLYIAPSGQFTWDTENRLIQTRFTSTAPPTRYVYDSGGRRIAKLVYDTSNNLTAATAYCYDGWNLIAEYNLSGGAWVVARNYTWGLDLSGSLQGAGGVGGLLAVTVATGGSSTGPTGIFYPTFDGNGNVEAYLTSAGSFQAIYQYHAFGTAFQEASTATTSTNQAHFFHRFSTKYQDDQTNCSITAIATMIQAWEDG